jgi:hypothetical protein
MKSLLLLILLGQQPVDTIFDTGHPPIVKAHKVKKAVSNRFTPGEMILLREKAAAFADQYASTKADDVETMLFNFVADNFEPEFSHLHDAEIATIKNYAQNAIKTKKKPPPVPQSLPAPQPQPTLIVAKQWYTVVMAGQYCQVWGFVDPRVPGKILFNPAEQPPNVQALAAADRNQGATIVNYYQPAR